MNVYNVKEFIKQKTGFVFSADKFLRSVLPKGWSEKRLLSVKNDVVKETNLLAETSANMATMGLTSKDNIKEVVTKFSRKYGTGLSNTDTSKKLPHGQDMLRNRVEGTLLYENAENIIASQKGRKFIWLPSNAKEPRHEHMLRYGKVFEVGASNLPSDDCFPGQSFGCKCGYQWVDEEPSEYSTFYEDYSKIHVYARKATLERVPKSIQVFMSSLMDYSIMELQEKFDFPKLRKSFERSFGSNNTTIESFRNLIIHNDTVKKKIRAGGKLSPTIKTIKDDTYNFYNYMKTPVRLHLYRGGRLTEDIESLKVGSKITVREPTYLSVSEESAEQFMSKSKPVMYEFDLLPESRVNPTMLISNFVAEGEMLLPPNAAFMVKSIEKDDGVTRIILRSIKDGVGSKRLLI